jgi:predicted ATP-binding protein involved in virulence
MEEIFASEINVKEAKVVKNLSIPLSDKERKHLLITGKNGSGKTSLLEELDKYLGSLSKSLLQGYQNDINTLNNFKTQLSNLELTPDKDKNTFQQIVQVRNQKEHLEKCMRNLGNARINFKNEHLLWEKANSGTFIIAFFDAKRHSNLKMPSGINKINLQQRYKSQENANQHFLQYLVNLKADRSFARDENEERVVVSIDKWFNHFQERLRDIFESPHLELKFDRKNYTFQILEEDKEPYSFNTLSDGYSAIISIVSELLLRMEAHEAKNHDMEGLVLVDEIETHLHVDLQKKILPFLIDFFPKIQFIVSTHSPFVLSSVANSVICDLESHIVTSDLSGYSYDALIESYFNSDKYSDIVKAKMLEYEKLALQNKLDGEEKYRLRELEEYFAHVPKYLSNELLVKLQEIKLKSLPTKRS